MKTIIIFLFALSLTCRAQDSTTIKRAGEQLIISSNYRTASFFVTVGTVGAYVVTSSNPILFAGSVVAIITRHIANGATRRAGEIMSKE